MKNSSVKVVLGAIAVVGVALLAKKVAYRRKTMKAILEEYGITEKTAFAVVDKIRELDKDKYEELKNKFKTQFASKCCEKRCES